MVAGICLGILFGMANASFIWATNTLFHRLENKPLETTATASVQGRIPETIPVLPGWAERTQARLKATVDRWVDPWLPLIGRPATAQQIIGGLLLLPGLMALRGFLGYLGTYCTSWVSYRMIRDLRVDVLAKLQSLSLDYHTRSTTGDLLTRVNNDTAALHRCLVLGLSDLTKEPVTILLMIGGLCMLNLKLTLLVLIFLPPCIIPLAVLGRKVRRANKGVVSSIVSQSSLLVEAMSSIRVVKAFGLESDQLRRYRDFNTQQVHHSMKITQARELVNPLIEVISGTGLGVLIVVIFYTQTSMAELVAFLTGVALMFNPIKKLGAIHVLFKETSVGVDRLTQVLNEQPSVQEPASPKPFTRFEKDITFRDVSFAYTNQPVLQGLDLTIPRGFKLGVAGESGSGKSTLVNLLYRFYDPTQGAVLIDGCDIREFATDDLRAQMALVSQEIVLFDETIAENIARGKPGASREEIESAAKSAFAHDFIMRLPLGYDSPVGERGQTLSVGQRQRLSIARAFVRNAPILVLDEATSALDSNSEAEVQAAIERLEQNRTVVCVAHRLSTLANMDEILVLSQGRVIERGSFQQLLTKDGAFAAMARQQGIRESLTRGSTPPSH